MICEACNGTGWRHPDDPHGRCIFCDGRGELVNEDGEPLATGALTMPPTIRSGMMVVPNELHDAINAKLDAAIAQCPGAEKDREHLYQQLLAYFDEYGVIPDFTIGQVAHDSMLNSDPEPKQ